MNRRNKRLLWLAGVFLILAALACSAPTPTTPTETPTAPQVGEGSVTPTPTPAGPTDTPPGPTDTPVPDVSGPGGCTLNAAYVADLTVPDGTEFSPGDSFIKTWQVRNTGTCRWEPGTELVHISGDHMGGPASVTVPPVAPGTKTDVSVNLAAPSSPGTYKGNWQLQAPDGTRFGAVLYVQIVVPGPATETPTPTPSSTPGTPAPVCTPPLCATDEVLVCPGVCPGGCGVQCVTPTTSPCVDVDPDLEQILDHMETLGHDVGCPTDPASSISGAFQEFWANVDAINPHLHFRSLMIWRSDTEDIYVIDGEDTNASQGALLTYADTWEEGQPSVHPDCAGMSPPTGYQLPVRGFGKVWCVNDLEDPVGWPGTTEKAVTLLVQPTQKGLLMKVYGAIPMWYLVALDFEADRAWTVMTGP